MEFFSDNDSEVSVPECNSRRATNNIEEAKLQALAIDHERLNYDQTLLEMNNQTRELTAVVKAFADQISSTISNRERNTPVKKEEYTHDAVNRDTLCDSDCEWRFVETF